MKTQFNFRKYFLLSFFIILFVSCENPVKRIHPEDMYGRIIVNVDVTMAISSAGGRLAEVSPDDLIVEIFNASGDVHQSFERYGDLPPEITVEPGSYYVVARTSGEPVNGFENPYYYGESDIFSIDYEETVSIDIIARLANCMVSVVYSQNIVDQFTDYSTEVSSDGGAVTFSAGETRPAYFPLTSLTIMSTLYYLKADGTSASKIVEGSIQDPMPQTHYEVQIDAQVQDGSLPVGVTIDPAVNLEIIQLSDQSQTVVEGPVGYGELVISEIMYNPAALSDSEGEYFEIFNTADQAIELSQTVIKKGTEIQFIIEELITIDAGQYLVLAKHVNAVPSSDYVYGSSLSLLNSGDEIILANYGTNGSNGSVICSVNYGLAGFPDANGASLNLNVNTLDADAAKEGANWCLSTLAFETGDLGTPGTANEECN